MFPKKFYMNLGVGHMHELQYIRKKSFKKNVWFFSNSSKEMCSELL